MIEVTTTGMVNIVACAVFIVVGVLSWHGRIGRPVTAVALTSTMVGSFWWAVTVVLATSVQSEAVSAWAQLAAFPGIGLTVAAFVILTYGAGSPGWVPSRRVLAALAIEPVIVSVVALTNRWHGWIYTWMDTGDLFPAGGPVGEFGALHGPVYWLNAAYSYALILVGIGLVFRGWRRAPRVFKLQRLLLFVGCLPPVLMNAAHILRVINFGSDPSTSAFALTGMVLGYALLRHDLLVLAPVARELVVDRVSDAIIVVGPDGRVLDANPAAVELVQTAGRARMPKEQPPALVGRPVRSLLGGALTHDGSDDTTQLTIEVDGRSRDLHTRSSTLIDRRRREIGWVVVLRDVTELNRQRHELALANERLVSQVETIERLRHDLAEQASRDSLTGLHNRRHVSAHLGPMIEAAAGHGGDVGVLMIDLDHFKSINDRFGHTVGDAVLVAMAETLADLVPSGALAARWGGEEFLVVLPGADRDATHGFAETLRTRLGERVVTIGDLELTCTTSIGIVSAACAGASIDDLLLAADQALYAAKNAGRNRVATAHAAIVRD